MDFLKKTDSQAILIAGYIVSEAGFYSSDHRYEN